MCGACGRTTTLDPVLGETRTRRQHIIVAGAINDVCDRVPGSPKVKDLMDGWSVTGPTGAVKLCSSVAELWSTVIDLGFRSDDRRTLLAALQQRVLRETHPADGDGLPRRVIEAGQQALIVRSAKVGP